MGAGAAVPQLVEHGVDHAVVELLVLLVGSIGQGADEAAGPGDVRLQAHIGNRLDQFQIVHEVVIRVYRYFLTVNLANGGAKGFPLFGGLESQPLLDALDVALVDFQRPQFAGLGVFILPHPVGAEIFSIYADNHIDIIEHILADGQGFVHIGVEHFGHDPLTVQPLGGLEVLQVFGPVVGIGDVVQDDPLQSLEDIVSEHALAFVGFRTLNQQLDGPTQVSLPQPLLAESFGDVRVLIEGVDDLGQGLDALFAGHLAGRQFQGFDGRELLRPGQTAQYDRHRSGKVQVGILVQIFAVQGGAGVAADGIDGQPLLELVVGVVGNIADTAAVDDGGFLFFRQKAVEFRIVAGGDDQRVNGPLVTVDLDVAILDDPQIDLDQVLFILEDFIGKMDAAAGHPRQGPSPQVEAVRVGGVGDVQQSLNGLFAQQIHRRRGNLVFCRILAGDGPQTLGHGNRKNIYEFEHFRQVAIAGFPDVVPDEGAAGAQGAVIDPQGFDLVV